MKVGNKTGCPILLAIFIDRSHASNIETFFGYSTLSLLIQVYTLRGKGVGGKLMLTL